MLAVVLIPVLLAALLRRFDRRLVPLELGAAGLIAIATVLAVAWYPAEAWGAVRIMVPVVVFGTIAIVLCAAAEAIPSTLRGLMTRRPAVAERGPRATSRPEVSTVGR